MTGATEHTDHTDHTEHTDHRDDIGDMSSLQAADFGPDELVAGTRDGADATGMLRDEGPNAVEVAEAWLAQLSDQIAVSASDVQDHLLDLWGALDDGPARSEVERWLTETLRRNLYSVSDINDRLGTLLPAG